MYRNTKLLCCVTGNNSVVGRFKNKLIEKEMRFVVIGGEVWGRGNWMKGVRRYKPPAIRWISTRDVMYSMTRVMNMAVCYMWKMSGEWSWEFPSQGDIFFYFFNFVWEDGWSLHLPWSLFHDACKSDHYAAHLKCLQCCRRLYVRETGRKKLKRKSWAYWKFRNSVFKLTGPRGFWEFGMFFC